MSADEKVLLNAREVAYKIGYEYEYFMSTVRHWPQIPRPLDLPGQPRWSKEEIERWANEHARVAA